MNAKSDPFVITFSTAMALLVGGFWFWFILAIFPAALIPALLVGAASALISFGFIIIMPPSRGGGE